MIYQFTLKIANNLLCRKDLLNFYFLYAIILLSKLEIFLAKHALIFFLNVFQNPFFNILIILSESSLTFCSQYKLIW